MQTGLERVNTARRFEVVVNFDDDLMNTPKDLAGALRKLADRIEGEIRIAGLTSNVLTVDGALCGTWKYTDGVRG